MRGTAALAAMLPLLLLLLLLLAPGATMAQDWVPQRTAELQLLDKVTARVSVLRARVGEPVSFGTLTILVQACNARPPDEVPDAAAYLRVGDDRRAAGNQQVFQGWMFANAPGVSMLEHPVYDLRVLDCR
jgi:hypothetical protein